MKRERYTVLLPGLVFSLVAIGFVVGLIFPQLDVSFYVVFIVAAGVVILSVDRIVRRRVEGAITDERLQSLAERAAWVAFRISIVAILATAMVLTYLYPATVEARLVAAGACCAIGLQAMVHAVGYAVMRGRR